MDIVKEIAVMNIDARRNAILARLDAMGVKWELQHAGRYMNIRVPLHAGGAPLVIGAHYDNVSNSTGANDNASSCSILLRLIEALKDTRKCLEFVFFDGEEQGGLGSKAYIQLVGKKNISAMLNLDVCGYGDVIAMESNGYIDEPRFFRVTDSAVLQAHQVVQTNFMPFGDNWIFRDWGIPTVGLCALPTQDAEVFRQIGSKSRPTFEDGERLRLCKVMSTMHHKQNDSIASVSQVMLNKVTAFVLEGLQ